MVDHGILDSGRAQYITLQPPGEGSLTIINVYAPTLSTDRAHLWSKVESANLTSDHYILGGDLNHQEPKEANNSTNTRQRTRRESSAWHAMTLKLGLSDAWELDSFHKLSKTTYTYDNGQQGPPSVQSRIDKFLVSQSVEERGGQIEISPSVRKLSDHLPLTIKIWGLQRTTQGNRPSYFDLSLLGEEKGRKELLDAWTGAHPPPLSPPLIVSIGKDGWSQLLAGSCVATCISRKIKGKRGELASEPAPKKFSWPKSNFKRTQSTLRFGTFSRRLRRNSPKFSRTPSRGTNISTLPNGCATVTLAPNPSSTSTE